VEVGIAETGGDGFALEVEELGVRGGEALCGGVVSCVEDFAVVDGQGGGAREAVVEGDEVGVEDDQVGGDSWHRNMTFREEMGQAPMLRRGF
jgi:hypothetical protein